MKRFNFLFVLLFIFTISCKKNYQNDTFMLNDNFIDILDGNKHCKEIFEKGFGVDSLSLKKYDYAKALIGKIINKNKENDFNKFIYFQLTEKGELNTITLVSIGILPNGEGVIKKYIDKNNNVEEITKTIKIFNIEKLYSKLGLENIDFKNYRTNIFLIDFGGKGSCQCRFYGNIENSKIKAIKDLTFFDNGGK